VVVIQNETLYDSLSESLAGTDIKVYAGQQALEQVTGMETIDMVLMAILGFDALKPLLAALENRKPVALANKESLVVAGDLITKAAIENRTPIIPVDSEHSAIFQSLMGEGDNRIDKVVLTASGGPFLNFKKEELQKITPDSALKHPNWKMGDKISVDSATLMNKGMEAMEAMWLFDLSPSQIKVIIHPQSIVHALVYFTDGNVKSVLSTPDMRIPIQFALSYPNRLSSNTPKLDLLKTKALTFQKPDKEIFRNLALAFRAMEIGGNLPCILNAANDIAVEAFLEGKLDFLAIPEIVEKCMNEIKLIKTPSLHDYIETDKNTRIFAKTLIENKHQQ